MKRFVWGLCALLALCAAGRTTVYAEELPVDSYSDNSVDFMDDPEIVSDPEIDPVASSNSTLSDEHIAVLDKLGELLEYESTVSENTVEDEPVVPEVETDILSSLQSIDMAVSTLSDVSLYSDFTAFNGAISSTYLELFRGFLPKLSYDDHYVLYRESQYVYSFVFGSDLSFNGTRFTGSDLTRVYFNAYNGGSFGHSSESSFGLSVGGNVVYTDLGTYYPSLSSDIGSNLIVIKWLVLVTVLAIWMISLFKGIRRRGDRDKMWSSRNTV